MGCFYGIVLPTLSHFPTPLRVDGWETPPGLPTEAGAFALWLRRGLSCSAGATHWSKFEKWSVAIQRVSSIDHSYHIISYYHMIH